jgi:AbrB family looped-hinge helix DNA binding protein
MGHRVGAKGQIVIEKAIRDQLGIQPGSEASQRVVDGRLEIAFQPPRHRRSLLGAARPFITKWPKSDEVESLDEGIAEGVASDAREKLVDADANR